MQNEKRSLADLATDGLAQTSGTVVLATEQPAWDLKALTNHPRIMAFCQFNSRDRHWQLPVDQGQTLLLLTSLQAICFSMLLQAWRAKIRWIVSPKPCGWKCDRITSLMLRQVRGKLNQLASTWIMGSLSSNVRKGKWKGLRRLAATGLRNRLQQILAAAPPPSGEKNRVLVVTPTLSAGGAERLVSSTLEYLLPALPDLRLFCMSLDHNSGHDFFLPNVTPFGLPIISGERFLGWQGGPPLDDVQVLMSLLPERIRDEVLLHLAAFRETRPESVYVWQDFTNICGGIAAVLAGVPRIVLSTVSMAPIHFHHYLPIMGTFYRALAARSNVTLVNNSAMGAADYERWLGLKPGRIRVLRNGLTDLRAGCPSGAGAALRESLGIPLNSPVVGAVQRMAEVKDPDLWIAAARLVIQTRPEAHFLLVGDGPSLSQMRSRIMELGLSSSVSFTGAMENPQAAFDAMDVFLLTSHNEGLPNGVIEAQMMGVPVVAAKVGGVPEAIDDGRTGRLVSGRDPGAYAKAVLAMLENRPSAEDCRSFALSRFGIDRMIEETLDLLGYKTP